MADVTIRELRNHGGAVVERVLRGEHVTVTHAGRPVAELRPLRPAGSSRQQLVERRRRLPAVDPARLRADVDTVVDPRAVNPPPAEGLLDTSTLLLLGRLTDMTTLPEQPVISVVTLAELSVGPLVASSDEERAARQAHLQQAEADFDPLVFDAPAARMFGHVAASLRRAGRKPAARSFDAMIAAVALAHDLPVHTCNPGDFAGVDGLTVVAVPHPDG